MASNVSIALLRLQGNKGLLVREAVFLFTLCFSFLSFEMYYSQLRFQFLAAFLGAKVLWWCQAVLNHNAFLAAIWSVFHHVYTLHTAGMSVFDFRQMMYVRIILLVQVSSFLAGRRLGCFISNVVLLQYKMPFEMYNIHVIWVSRWHFSVIQHRYICFHLVYRCHWSTKSIWPYCYFLLK